MSFTTSRRRAAGSQPLPSAISVLSLSIALTACGGGGNGGDAAPAPAPEVPPPAQTPPPPPPPAQQAFTIELDAEKLVIQQGQTLTLRATVRRAAGFSAAVLMELGGLPAGVSASPVLVAEGADSASLVLAAAASAPHSLPTAASANGRAGTVSTSRPFILTVRGGAGAVDTSFAGGRTSVATEDFARAVTVQSDGKVLVAGSSSTPTGTRVSLVRYGRDGGLDAGFGEGGKVLTQLGTRGDDGAYAIALQADGKILVAGSSDRGTGSANLDFALVRYHADGTLDTSFGNGGIVTTDFGSDSDRAFALLVLNDGRIVLGGEANAGASTTGVDFAIALHRSDGTLDPTFGNGGKITTALKNAGGSDIVRALAVQQVNGSHRLLAVGGDGDFLAARYTADGTLDAGFGVNGKVVGLFGSTIGAAHAVSVLPTGEAVLAGHIGNNFAAARLTIDGQLDARFATAGRFTHALSSGNWDQATALQRQADGKLLLAGWVYAGSGSAGDFALVRLTPDGALDTGFGNQGASVVPMAEGTRNDQARAIALQADERVPAVRAVIAGEASAANYEFALTRLWL